jgi:GNAT superfamily N-acetyltransferase
LANPPTPEEKSPDGVCRPWPVELATAPEGATLFEAVELARDREKRREQRHRAPRRPDHLLLDNVAVAPDAQGMGIGAQLLRLADETAARSGLGEIRLFTNEAMTENLGYYARKGYVETGRGVQDGYRRVFFRKIVGSPRNGISAGC